MKTVTFFLYTSNYILKAKVTFKSLNKTDEKKKLKIFSKFHAIPSVLLQDSVAIYWSVRVTTCLPVSSSLLS